MKDEKEKFKIVLRLKAKHPLDGMNVGHFRVTKKAQEFEFTEDQIHLLFKNVGKDEEPVLTDEVNAWIDVLDEDDDFELEEKPKEGAGSMSDEVADLRDELRGLEESLRAAQDSNESLVEANSSLKSEKDELAEKYEKLGEEVETSAASYQDELKQKDLAHKEEVKKLKAKMKKAK